MNAIADIEGFRLYLSGEDRAENTIISYAVGVTRFFERYDTVTRENVIAFKRDMMEMHKPKTVNARLSAIMEYAKFSGVHFEKVKSLKINKQISVENVISRDEFERLCCGLRNDGNMRGYWMVMFLAKTGARVSEFRRLRKSALDRGYEELWTKGKIRRIYIPAALIEASRDYFGAVDGDVLFPAQRGGMMCTRGIAQLLQTWGKRYGIRKEVMHPHGFRHFYAKEFLRNGGELSLLSDLLGHESIATTAIYTRKTSDEMAADLSRIMMGEMNIHMSEALA